MKTQKIFLLTLALVLVLSVLASCGAGSAYPDCFVFAGDEPSFIEPTELDGEILAVNEEYNLVAFETRSLGTDGTSRRTVKVIDVSDGNRVVFTDEQSFYADSTGRENEIDLDNYPVIKVTSHSFRGYDDGLPEYEDNYSYYLIQKNADARSLRGYANEDELYVEEINNIWLVEDGQTLYWVNKNLAVMREMPLDVAETYRSTNYEDFFKFEAEYDDYLYTWEFEATSQVVIVYDPNGLACAKYTFPSGQYVGDPYISVLNDGNVLIQEKRVVEDGEAYDYTYGFGPMSYDVDLITKVMNYKTGEVKEVEFDYLITHIASNYELKQQNEVALCLADGFENQAVLTPVADGKLGREMVLAVISNELDIQWRFYNKYTSYPAFEAYNENGYVASVVIDGRDTVAIFTWDGELVAELPTNFSQRRFTEDVYVTASGVYTWDGELVFDIENSDFYNAQVYVIGECVYFEKENDLKLGEWNIGTEEYEKFEELYKLNIETGELELIADGEDTFAQKDLFTDDGVMVIKNEKKNTRTVYNAAGEVVLVVSDADVEDAYLTENALIVEVEIGNENKFYIFDLGDQLNIH